MVSRLSWLSLTVALFALLTACGNDAKKAEGEKSIDDRFAIKVGDRTVQMQVAFHPAEMQKGLMHRKTMAEAEGMIFVFTKPQQMGFWMKNTPLPLDIGYFDVKGELKEIYPLYPFDERSVRSTSTQLQLALEMNQGWYARNGVKPGAKIDVAELEAALKARGVEPRTFGLGAK